MYHALLTNRYLTTRVIPFIAVAAVALCTALVIIVVSVMSGFVDMVRDAGKTLMGDVVIAYPIRGLPHYDRILDELRALRDVEAASPVVDSWGLLKMPYDETEVVQVWGVEPDSFAHVTEYEDALYWRPIDDGQWVNLVKQVARERWEGLKANPANDMSDIEALSRTPEMAALLEMAPIENRQAILNLPESRWKEELPGLIGDAWVFMVTREPRLRDHPDDPLNMERVLEHGITLQVPGPEGTPEDALVAGIHVSQANRRRSDGSYRVLGQGSYWLPRHEVTLTLLPIGAGGHISDEPSSRIFPVANEAQFGVYQIDDKRVIVPIGVAQSMLDLEAHDIVDEDEIDLETGMPTIIGRASSRATLVLVKAAEGVTPRELKPQVIEVYEAVAASLQREGAREHLPPLEIGATIKTWEEQNAEFIGPVEKERNLMRILFSIIYFVCAGLVLVIFWAIVYEKTRDIGILRSIGASRIGVIWIFVRYGVVVGVTGSIVGLGLAWLVVHNINHIHNALGSPFPIWAWAGMYLASSVAFGMTVVLLMRDRLLPVVVLALLGVLFTGIGVAMQLHQGFLVWDPKVYYFSSIPNTIDTTSAAVTMVGAVVFSIIGALFPAARAGDIDPVDALRYG